MLRLALGLQGKYCKRTDNYQYQTATDSVCRMILTVSSSSLTPLKADYSIFLIEHSLKMQNACGHLIKLGRYTGNVTNSGGNQTTVNAVN